MPVVRDAAPEDAVRISEIQTRTWQSAYARAFPPEALAALTADRAVDRWRRAIEEPHPHMHTIVASLGGDVVGFASLGAARGEDEAGCGELFAIYVLPDRQGHGVGRALMTETLGRLRGEGFGEAVLWVLEDNPRTHRFYELAGWSVDGGSKAEEWLGTLVREIRFRTSLQRGAAHLAG